VLSGCKKDAVNPDDDEPNLNNPILQLENERLDNVVPDATVFAFLQGYIEDEFGQSNGRCNGKSFRNHQNLPMQMVIFYLKELI
jgi:hypothetical protein